MLGAVAAGSAGHHAFCDKRPRSGHYLEFHCLSFITVSLTDRKQWGKVSLSLNSMLTFDLSTDLALHFYRMARGAAKNCAVSVHAAARRDIIFLGHFVQ